MFLRCCKRLKDGKEHFYWSVVENRRLLDGRVVQRHVLYLGELNGRQEASWRKSVGLFGQEDGAPQQVALFPEEFAPVQNDDDALPIVRVRLWEMSLRRPRQWGACWLGCELWRQLGLDTFWGERLHASRKGASSPLVASSARSTAQAVEQINATRRAKPPRQTEIPISGFRVIASA